MAERAPYTVEIGDAKGCPHCGRGGYWDVVGPDGVALGRSYGKREEADEMAAELSRAYEAGRKGQPADDIISRIVWDTPVSGHVKDEES